MGILSIFFWRAVKFWSNVWFGGKRHTSSSVYGRNYDFITHNSMEFDSVIQKVLVGWVFCCYFYCFLCTVANLYVYISMGRLMTPPPPPHTIPPPHPPKKGRGGSKCSTHKVSRIPLELWFFLAFALSLFLVLGVFFDISLLLNAKHLLGSVQKTISQWSMSPST